MNVHPTMDFEGLCQNIEKKAVQVRRELRNLGVDRPMGLGLWIPADVAFSIGQAELDRLRTVLENNEFLAFTFNGFPYGNFHQAVVKKEVYKPTWAEASRLEYTQRLIEIMHQVLPSGFDGSISTLPLGWPDESNDGAGSRTNANDDFFRKCSENLVAVSNSLNDLAERSGRHIAICIEPEPGCILDTADDMIRFFSDWIFQIGEGYGRYIKICHDVCHSSVMRENQVEVIENYNKAGVEIGKVQVSAAPQVVFADDGLNSERLQQLAEFAEPKYLHQTSTDSDGLVEDLALALENCQPTGRWVAHFHVPVFLPDLGLIETTQNEIFDAVLALQKYSAVQHFEIETYAWNVFPQNTFDSVEAGIAQELKWFFDSFAK